MAAKDESKPAIPRGWRLLLLGAVGAFLFEPMMWAACAIVGLVAHFVFGLDWFASILVGLIGGGVLLEVILGLVMPRFFPKDEHSTREPRFIVELIELILGLGPLPPSSSEIGRQSPEDKQRNMKTAALLATAVVVILAAFAYAFFLR